MGEIEINYGSTLPSESLKVIAESVGIGNLSDDAAKEISDSATYRLKLVLQVNIYIIFIFHNIVIYITQHIYCII